MILCLKPLSSYNEIDFPFASPLLPALLHTQAGSPLASPAPLRLHVRSVRAFVLRTPTHD
jgi:hypothetical protein